MKAGDIVSFSWGAIRLRKVRAGLTTLGVVVGITAIVALLSISTGYQVALATSFDSGFSLDTVTVSAGSGFFNQDTDISLYLNDTEIIDQIQYVENSTGVISETCTVTIGESSQIAPIVGVDFELYPEMYDTFTADLGEIPSDGTGAIAVIGSNFIDPWGNKTDGIYVGYPMEISWTGMDNGTLVTKNITLTVVAILPEIGTTGITSGKFGFVSTTTPTDTGIYIPLEYAEEIFDTEVVDVVLVKVIDHEQMTIDYVTDRITSIYDGNVQVTTSNTMLETVTSSLATTEGLLVGIAGISLLVAGFGIMNIMIVSLMERTREIGILKALGMKNRTVMSVFMSEALLVGVIGSLSGILLGYSLSFVLAQYATELLFGGNTMTRRIQDISFTPILTLDMIIGAIIFGIATSVIFGIYPAWRASRLTPVEALRSE